MKIPILPALVLLASFLPAALSIQTIFLGIYGASGLSPRYIAWFSDSDVCMDGVTFGVFVDRNFDICGQDITILGHTGIRFTGCTGPHTPPTGVSDGGAPALTCQPYDGPYISCEVGDPNPAYTNYWMYCT